MTTKITLTYVTGPFNKDRTFTYKTLKGAQTKAQELMGEHPSQDPDGYAVNQSNGNCLFFSGSTFDELFPNSGWVYEDLWLRA